MRLVIAAMCGAITLASVSVSVAQERIAAHPTSDAAQPRTMMPDVQTYHLTCFGHSGTCIEYHHPGSTVWRRIYGVVIWEQLYTGLAEICPTGYESNTDIFVFDPGSETAGIGYVGTHVCTDDADNSYLFEQQSTSTQYTSYSTWYSATH